jgi:hypothetical protein
MVGTGSYEQVAERKRPFVDQDLQNAEPQIERHRPPMVGRDQAAVAAAGLGLQIGSLEGEHLESTFPQGDPAETFLVEISDTTGRHHIEHVAAVVAR